MHKTRMSVRGDDGPGAAAGLGGIDATGLSLLLIPSGAETPVFWASQRLASLVAPTRRDDLKLSRGTTAKLRENAVKQDHVQATNTIGITRKGPDFHAGRN